MNWINIGSGNGLSPDWHQAITWTNAALLSIIPLRTNYSEIWINIQNFSFMINALENAVCKMAAILSRGRWVNTMHEAQDWHDQWIPPHKKTMMEVYPCHNVIIYSHELSVNFSIWRYCQIPAKRKIITKLSHTSIKIIFHSVKIFSQPTFYIPYINGLGQ